MSFDFDNDSSFDGAPWLARTEPGECIKMEVKPTTAEKVPSETPWGETNEMICEFRNIVDEDGDSEADDGEHVIPFWACKAFVEMVRSIPAKKRSKWNEVVYKRTEYNKPNRDGVPTTYSEAHWAIKE